MLFDKIRSGSKNIHLLKKVPEFTDESILYKQNIDLQKKIDILEESINYYKNLNADSQKIIKQASKELQNLSLEKSDLAEQASKDLQKLSLEKSDLAKQASKELQNLSLEKSDLIKQVSELTAKNREFLPSWYVHIHNSFRDVAKMILRLDRKSIQ